MRPMCFDTKAYNIGGQSAVCDDREYYFQDLLCLACSHCCGRKSVQIFVMVHRLGPSLAYQFHDYCLQNDKSQFHTAYACVEVFMKLANLLQCKFLTSQQTHDDYHELLQQTVLSLCDSPPCIVYGSQSYAQRLVDDQVVVLCLYEHLGTLTAIQNNSSQLGVER